jgi:hypothetical protein
MTAFESLVKELVLRSGTYVMVRPGITLRLSYPEPIQTLGPAIASVLEQYLQFIGPESLQTYLASSGTWKALSKGGLTKNLRELRSIPRHYEFVEYHYGHGTPANVGDYGAHFKGWNLANEDYPLRENLLLLEFPANFFERKPVDQFVDFVAAVASSHPFGSGGAGYSFKNLHLSFRDQAFAAIGAMAPRYVGFDIDSDTASNHSRGFVYNVSWLTLLGTEIVQKLGGPEKIAGELAPGIQVRNLPTGVMIRAAASPIVGDVNRGAEDAAPLVHLAGVTRPVRMGPHNLGPLGDFAERWLARFDTR